MIFRLLILTLLLFFAVPSVSTSGKRIYIERGYQESWCSAVGGTMEYVLPDKSRVDCLTDEYAIEFDFADKWAESIGQAMYYSIITGRKPGIVIIIEDMERDENCLSRLKMVAEKLGITVWEIKN